MTNPVKVAEFGDTGALVTVYQKFSESAQKIFFDVACVSECVEGSKRYLSPLTRIEKVPYLVIAVLEAMTYISDRHKEIRDAGSIATVDASSAQCHGIEDLDPAQVRAGLSPLKEFKCGSVAVEVVVEEVEDVQVFSLCCWREYATGAGERNREFYIQQRDLRDLAIALLRAWLYVQENWGSTPVTSRRW